MDPSSSSVGFPHSGNTQSPKNPTSLPSSVGFPSSGSTHSEISPRLPSSSAAIPSSEYHQSTQNPSSLHPPSSSVGIPSSANPQSNPEQQSHANGPPIIMSSADWNRELVNLHHVPYFYSFMIGGPCRDDFIEWYECMYRGNYMGRDRANCTRLAAVVGDCIFANPDYHHSLIGHLAAIQELL